MSSAATTPSEMPVALRVNGLRIDVWHEMGWHAAIGPLDFSIRAGEVLALVGESGSGKTLTGLAIQGLLNGGQVRPGAGSIELDGEIFSHTDIKSWRSARGRLISQVPQQHGSALDPVLRVGRQLLRVLQRQRRLDDSTALEEATRLLQHCGLPEPKHVMKAFAHQLSGGMRQRCLLAMALACEPRVLIADEPTSALDLTHRQQILQLIRDNARTRAMAVLLISHDLGAVAEIADQVVVLYAGREMESGPAAAVLKDAKHPYTRALLAATPRWSMRRGQAPQPIPGRVPALVPAQSGCVFAARCPQSADLCEAAPQARAVTQAPADDQRKRRVYCHFSDQAGIALHE